MPSRAQTDGLKGIKEQQIKKDKEEEAKEAEKAKGAETDETDQKWQVEKMAIKSQNQLQSYQLTVNNPNPFPIILRIAEKRIEVSAHQTKREILYLAEGDFPWTAYNKGGETIASGTVEAKNGHLSKQKAIEIFEQRVAPKLEKETRKKEGKSGIIANILPIKESDRICAFTGGCFSNKSGWLFIPDQQVFAPIGAKTREEFFSKAVFTMAVHPSDLILIDNQEKIDYKKWDGIYPEINGRAFPYTLKQRLDRENIGYASEYDSFFPKPSLFKLSFTFLKKLFSPSLPEIELSSLIPEKAIPEKGACSCEPPLGEETTKEECEEAKGKISWTPFPVPPCGEEKEGRGCCKFSCLNRTRTLIIDGHPDLQQNASRFQSALLSVNDDTTLLTPKNSGITSFFKNSDWQCCREGEPWRDRLLIIGIGHGSNNGWLWGGETRDDILAYTDLEKMISQNVPNCVSINVMIAACYSGKAITDLARPLGRSGDYDINIFASSPSTEGTSGSAGDLAAKELGIDPNMSIPYKEGFLEGLLEYLKRKDISSLNALNVKELKEMFEWGHLRGDQAIDDAFGLFWAWGSGWPSPGVSWESTGWRR